MQRMYKFFIANQLQPIFLTIYLGTEINEMELKWYQSKVMLNNGATVTNSSIDKLVYKTPYISN